MKTLNEKEVEFVAGGAGQIRPDGLVPQPVIKPVRQVHSVPGTPESREIYGVQAVGNREIYKREIY